MSAKRLWRCRGHPSDRLIPRLPELSGKAMASPGLSEQNQWHDTAFPITEDNSPCPAVSYNIARLVNFCELSAGDITMITLKLNPL